MTASQTYEASKPDQTPPPKKSWQEAVLTATPVVLTVVATALAGLSTSEMTLAQYHRSLAAQNQSKASDQWGFFQAKRLRGTAIENAFDLLPPNSKPKRLEVRDLELASHRLTRAIQEAEKQAADMEKALASADLGIAGDPMKGLKEKCQESAAASLKIEQQIRQELGSKESLKAFEYLSVHQLPEVEDVDFSQADIDEASQSINNRVGEMELDPVLRKIHEADLQKAIEAAEGNARRFEAAGKPIGKTLDQIDQQVGGQIACAAQMHQAVRAYQMVYDTARPGLSEKDGADLKSAAEKLDKSDSSVQAAASEIDSLFKAGKYSYTARRQRREADYNFKTAGLFEIQVRLNSFTSDRHRTRSKMFFFGMLAAQAGVTIASLSLAVHKRNVLWALAGLAGIAAITFSGYVYLYM
jgi:hypothetical protein